jgi:hypothetical protein
VILWVSLIEIIYFAFLVLCGLFLLILGIPLAVCGTIGAKTLRKQFLIPYAVLQIAKIFIWLIILCIWPSGWVLFWFMVTLIVWSLYLWGIARFHTRVGTKTESELVQLRPAVTWCCC